MTKTIVTTSVYPQDGGVCLSIQGREISIGEEYVWPAVFFTGAFVLFVALAGVVVLAWSSALSILSSSNSAMGWPLLLLTIALSLAVPVVFWTQVARHIFTRETPQGADPYEDPRAEVGRQAWIRWHQIEATHPIIEANKDNPRAGVKRALDTLGLDSLLERLDEAERTGVWADPVGRQ